MILNDEQLWQEAKQWFSDSNYDVNAMVMLGAVTKERIIAMYLKEHGRDKNEADK
jgi:hypothetical protein